jgi:hypothetical protein
MQKNEEQYKLHINKGSYLSQKAAGLPVVKRRTGKAIER